MTEQQIDLGNYKGEVVERKTFDDQNKGKPLLNSDDEYVFRLAKFPHGYPKTEEKLNADKSITIIKKTMAICEFEETSTKNIVTTQFRIDKLNFGDDEKFQSGLVKFFKKLGSPLTENKYPELKEKFVVGMRFRGRVVVKTAKDKDNNDVTKYYLDVPTVRKLMASDTAGETFAEQPPAHDPTKYTPETLANALLLAKGAKTHSEAMDKLKLANAPRDVVMAMFNAELDGKVKYPI